MSLKFLAGLAVGAVVVHLLETEEGKAFLCRLKTDLRRTSRNLSAVADGLVEQGKRIINGTGNEAIEPSHEQLIVVVESNPVV